MYDSRRIHWWFHIQSRKALNYSVSNRTFPLLLSVGKTHVVVSTRYSGKKKLHCNNVITFLLNTHNFYVYNVYNIIFYYFAHVPRVGINRKYTQTTNHCSVVELRRYYDINIYIMYLCIQYFLKIQVGPLYNRYFVFTWILFHWDY